MAKKKKTKPNGFSMFMFEFIRREGREGRKYPKVYSKNAFNRKQSPKQVDSNFQERHSSVAAPFWEVSALFQSLLPFDAFLTWHFSLFPKRLSPGQQEEYKRRAKSQPMQTKFCGGSPKYTTHGVLISDIEKKAHEKMEMKLNASKVVKDLVLSAFNDNGEYF